MRITKFGHACLLVEEGDARVLIDPGAFSSGFEDLADLDAILITHQHQDHVMPDKIKQLLAKNAAAKVYADEGSVMVLSEAGVEAQAVHEGDKLDVGGMAVEVIGRDHAPIHSDIPGIPNVGYLIGGRFFYPGDSLTRPGRPVEVLAVPTAAPWLLSAKVVDFMLEVNPKVAIPVHDAVLSGAGHAIYVGLLERFAGPAGVMVRVAEPGQPVEV